MALPPGKIPVEILKEVIFKNLGTKRKEVAQGPAAGIDAAVLNLGNQSLIVSMDPITGALERIGSEAVNINANDVSAFGVQPSFFLSCILLPEKTDRRTVEIISSQMHAASKKLGIAIIGGHCETTPGLTNPIVVGCAIGLTKKGNYVTAACAKPGDHIVITKTAGIEGTAILASDRKDILLKKLKSSVIKRAQSFFNKTSVVKEAVAAYKTRGAHAMHDPTEGGIAGGIHEIADASGLGFLVHENEIPVTRETKEICQFFQIDPLYLIASGSLLIATAKEDTEKVLKTLAKAGTMANIVGEFTASPSQRTINRKNGKMEELKRPVADHLWLALSRS